LAITKSDSPDPVLAGQPLTYTLTVMNNGPSPASAVKITDAVPAGTAFVSASASQGSCSQASGTVTCDVGTVANGASATATVTVRPTQAGPVSNTASVSSTTFDPVAGNNSDSEDTTVDPAADLSLTKSDSVDPATTGSSLVYTITVANAGPSTA